LDLKKCAALISTYGATLDVECCARCVALMDRWQSTEVLATREARLVDRAIKK